jgi:sulfur-oxidizing protein SoxB
MALHGKPIAASNTYKVASWAPVAEGASGEPVWDVLARYLRAKKVVRDVRPNRPTLTGVRGNPGVA